MEIQSQEKQQSEMIINYHQGIKMLKQGNIQQGINILQNLLIIVNKQPDLLELKNSCLISLGQIQIERGNMSQALKYYYEAAQTKNQFSLWLKFANMCQNRMLYTQAQYALKKALKKSPFMWRQKIYDKLLKLYEENQQHQQAQDLIKLLKNPIQIDRIIHQQIQQEQKFNSIEIPLLKRQINCKDITISLYQSQQNWEYVITMLYVILKCKSQRSFQSKKYLKKYQTTSNKWLEEFDPLHSKIILRFEKNNQSESIEQQDGQNQSQKQSIKQFNIKTYIKQYIQRYAPKKKRKNNKKSSAINHNYHKNNYTTISAYFQSKYHNANLLKQLTIFQLFDSSHQLYKKIIEPIVLQIQKDDPQIQKVQNANALICEKKVKEIVVDTKSYSGRDFEQYFNERNQHEYIYNNIYYFSQTIIKHILAYQSQPNQCIKDIYLKKHLIKVIVKLIQQSQGFILYQNDNNQINIVLFQLLIEKLDQLFQKLSKMKQYRIYQQSKIQDIYKFIEKYYSIQQFIETKKQQILICRIALSLIKFYSLPQIKSQPSYNYYLKIYKYYINKINPLQNLWWLNNQQLFIQDIDNFLQHRLQKFINKINYGQIDQINIQGRSQIVPQNDYQSIIAINNAINSLEKQDTNIISYFNYLIEYFNIFFQKLLNIKGQFHSKNIPIVTQMMNLQKIIFRTHQQLVKHYNTQNKVQISQTIIIENLFLLIKLYLLQPFEDPIAIFRIILSLTNLYIKNYLKQQENLLKIMIYFYNLANIKIKKLSQDNSISNNLKRKYYQILLSKNLTIIFKNLQKISDQQNQDFQEIKNKLIQSSQDKLKNDIHNINNNNNNNNNNINNIIISNNNNIINNEDIISQNSIRIQKYQSIIQNKFLQTQKQKDKQKILTIFQQIYYDKQKQFVPRKIQDSIGYFMFISQAHGKQFECKQIDLQARVNKIFRKCFNLFAQKSNLVYQLCNQFQQFKILFESIINGQTKNINQHFIKVCKGQQKICQCCNIKDNNEGLLNVLFIIGKYFETQQSQKQREQDYSINGQQKFDEKYYLQLLMLDITSVDNWENIIRAHRLKAYQYFDSLIAEPREDLKQQFLITKRIATFVKNNLNNNFKPVTQCLIILNTLKIYERKFYLTLAQLKWQFNEAIHFAEKYKQGLIHIYEKSESSDLRMKYILLVQLKLPVFLFKIRDNINNNQNFLQLINKLAIQIQQLIEELSNIDQSKNNVKHLCQDIIVEFYIFILKIFQILFQSMNMNHSQNLLYYFQEIALFILSQKFQNKIPQEYRFNLQNISTQLFFQNYIPRNLPMKIKFNNQTFQQPNKLLYQIITLFKKIPKNQLKKYNYRRSVISALIWSSKIYQYYNNNLEQSNSIVKQYYNLKTDDIVYVYHHYQKKSTQRNQLLSQFYNRLHVYILKKIQFVLHLISIFREDLDNLTNLLKKLYKISQNDPYKMKTQFALFIYGFDIFLDKLTSISQKFPIDQKYEKLFLQWKKFLRKSQSQLGQSPIFKKIDKFTQEYQLKHQTKLKLKKKKQTQIQEEKSPNKLDIKKSQIIEEDKFRQNLKVVLKMDIEKEQEIEKDKPQMKQSQPHFITIEDDDDDNKLQKQSPRKRPQRGNKIQKAKKK